MKAVLIKARENFKAGDVIECSAEEFAILADGGYAISEAESKANDAVRAANMAMVDQAINAAVTRGAFEPKDATVRAKAVKWLESGVPVSEVCDVVNAMQAPQDSLTTRQTSPGGSSSGIVLQGVSLRDAGSAYVKAREPMDKLIREGKVKDAVILAAQSGAIMHRDIVPIANQHGDLILRDTVRAADTTDSNVGTIATGLILMRNLGFLKNKLGWMPYISTDLRNEPALFNQPVFTRYITPPAVVNYNVSTGWAASTPSTTDVTVTIEKHQGVQIDFQTQLLGSTARNLFAEQQGAQFYALAEEVNKYFLEKVFAATWSGIVSTFARSLANFNLPAMVALKNAMTLSKFPDVGRFALLHSCWHDKLLEDTNLLSAKAILALINKDARSFDSSELPTLFGVKALESQLCAATGGTLGSITDPANLGTINRVGFAGDSASMVFVARVPQDYTSIMKEIPATAAVEIVTDPDSGLSIMFVKYVNHQLALASARCALMYGAAQGDPRRGIVVTP